MENQLSRINDQPYKLSLTNALETGNKQEISRILNSFKTETGLLKYEAILEIPQGKRLPAMYAKDPKRATALVVVGLQMAFESMNLSRPMTAPQLLNLAEIIFDTSTEDRLSLQDVMLFLQGLTRGKYGTLYESMDIPKFMEKFEIYRQERHVEYLRIKETQHLQFKGMGPSDRVTQTNPMEAAVYNMAGRLSDMKEKLKEQREINRRLSNG